MSTDTSKKKRSNMRRTAAVLGGASALAVSAVLARALLPELRVRLALGSNARVFDRRERRHVASLLAGGGRYLFEGWPRAGVADEAKRSLVTRAYAAAAAAGGVGGGAGGEGDGAVYAPRAAGGVARLPASPGVLGAADPSLETLRVSVVEAPAAERKPKKMTLHGDERVDDYYWLRDDERRDPEVLGHIAKENAYTRAALADTREAQETLYLEMRGRIQEADESVPVRFGDFEYWTRTLEGEQYCVHLRRRVTGEGEGAEEVLLDENREARRHKFYSVGGFSVSPNDALLAYAVDTVGGEKYDLHVLDLSTRRPLLAAPIPHTSGNLAWAADSETLFWVTKDHLDRPYRVWRRKVAGGPSSAAPPAGATVDEATGGTLVFQEPDESFYVGIHRSRTDRVLYIHSGSAVTSQVFWLDAREPEGDFRPLFPRIPETEFSVSDDHLGRFYVEVRDPDRPNSELLLLDPQKQAPGWESWGTEPASTPAPASAEAASTPPAASDALSRYSFTTLLAHREDVRLEGAEVSERHLVSFERREGLQTAVAHPLPGAGGAAGPLGAGRAVEIRGETSYELSEGAQGDYGSDTLRLVYSSLKTPPTTLDVDLGEASLEPVVRRVQPVRGGHDPSKYATAREWATSEDGSVRIPVSIVWREDLLGGRGGGVPADGPADAADGRDGSAAPPENPPPLLLDAYGAYEISNDAGFSSARLALLDRGVAYAIAHVRGGGEMGRRWYEGGKYLKKKNTFSDVVDAAEHLVARGFADPRALLLEGRSAGGLTVGATLNLRPDLFAGAIAGVPFVDVLTTMLDPTIPLTVTEWEEWGDPRQPEYYDYMKSYSPIDNLRAAPYPPLLVTAGLHDPRVEYWEPAKYVAKLRSLSTSGNPTLLKVDLGAGHFSASGRFERLRERALELAFLLKVVDKLGTPPTPSAPAPEGVRGAKGA